MTRPNSLLTVISFLRRASQLFPDQGVVYGKKMEKYGELYLRVKKISAELKKIGVRKGDVVGVADWNTLRFFELLYSAAASGFIIYPVNIRLPPEHIFYTLKQSDCKWLIASEDFASIANKSGIPSERIIILRGDDDLAINLPDEFEGDEVSGEDPYSILYTSGTTGLPKGVLYTNDRVVMGAMSIVYQLGLFNASAKLTNEDVIMPLIPFFHLWGWGSPFHAAYLGAKYVVGGKFTVENTIDLIEREGVTWINAIPTMMYQLLTSSRGEELKGLKVLIGGSPVPKGLADRMDRLGIKYSTIYGGTDMLATAIQIKKTDNSIHPVPFVEFKIVTPEGKTAVKGEMGELYVRAPWLPDGYYKDEERSYASFEEGWFRTGDFAKINGDAGIQVLDRVKDVIKSGGEWIPTSMLESLISEVEGVASVAVIGIADQKWGERPVAVIKPEAGKGEKLVETIKKKLQDDVGKGKILSWWIPEQFITTDEIPLTSVGKIDKKVLKERYS